MRSIFTLLICLAIGNLALGQSNMSELHPQMSTQKSFNQVTPVYVSVDFYLEMYDATFDHDNDTVYVSGSFNNWLEPGAEGSIQLKDTNDNYYYTARIQLEENSGEFEYKYFLNSGFGGAEWEGDPNRIFTVGTELVRNDDLWGTIIGIQENNPNDIMIYPNPCSDKLTVNNIKPGSQIIIQDVLGKGILKTNTEDQSVNINTSDLTKGIYLISVIGPDQKVRTEKIIKK